jgi:hypothetical protein
LQQHIETFNEDVTATTAEKITTAFLKRFARETSTYPGQLRSSQLDPVMLTFIKKSLADAGELLEYPVSDSDSS